MKREASLIHASRFTPRAYRFTTRLRRSNPDHGHDDHGGQATITTTTTTTTTKRREAGHGPLSTAERWHDDPQGLGLPRRFSYWRPDALAAALAGAGFAVVDGWESATPKGHWLCRVAVTQ